MPRPARLKLTAIEIAICTTLALGVACFGTAYAYLCLAY